jgi:hypothetical protein
MQLMSTCSLTYTYDIEDAHDKEEHSQAVSANAGLVCHVELSQIQAYGLYNIR